MLSIMKLRPLGDRILVKRIKEEEKTKGGIIIPDTAKEKPQEGKVVAVGRGRGAGDSARSGRGNAVRPRLPLAVFRDRSGAHGSAARRCLHPYPGKENFLDEGPPADSRSD